MRPTSKIETVPKPKPNGIAKWQADAALTDVQAAAAFGLARNSFVKYRDGDAPRIVRLALAALQSGVKV